jgi:hypothetical protein
MLPNQWWKSIDYQLDDQNPKWKFFNHFMNGDWKKIDCHMIGNGKLLIVARLGTKKIWSL